MFATTLDIKKSVPVIFTYFRSFSRIWHKIIAKNYIIFGCKFKKDDIFFLHFFALFYCSMANKIFFHFFFFLFCGKHSFLVISVFFNTKMKSYFFSFFFICDKNKANNINFNHIQKKWKISDFSKRNLKISGRHENEVLMAQMES